VNIVISTLLLTFVAQQLIAYSVATEWFLQQSRGTKIVVAAQSNQLPSSARLNSFGEYPSVLINGGLIIAVVLTVLVAVALARSRWGFRVKIVGLNPRAAQHAGIPIARVSGLALALSGAFAGLAGAVLLTSPVATNRLQPGMSSNIGWDGLLVALVARNRPALCLPVAALFGILRAGGSFLAATGVPFYLVDVVKALLVLALVVPPVAADIAERGLGRRRLRRADRSAPSGVGAPA
jgi:simple sugar transport system permease protein